MQTFYYFHWSILAIVDTCAAHAFMCWPLTMTYDLDCQSRRPWPVYTRKIRGKGSGGSKVRVETNGRTQPISILSPLTRLLTTTSIRLSPLHDRMLAVCSDKLSRKLPLHQQMQRLMLIDKRLPLPCCNLPPWKWMPFTYYWHSFWLLCNVKTTAVNDSK